MTIFETDVIFDAICKSCKCYTYCKCNVTTIDFCIHLNFIYSQFYPIIKANNIGILINHSDVLEHFLFHFIGLL